MMRGQAAALMAALWLCACAAPWAPAAPPVSTPGQPADAGSGTIYGAGATFPAPFYLKAFTTYQQLHPSIAVSYDAVGSGAGISRFTQASVDFGASDVPLRPDELAAAGGDQALVELPTTVGVVAVAYNLPGVDNLRLDGPAVADLFLGKVKRWDDPELKRLNPQANLPPRPVEVAHRADSSGTTFAFTDYLSKVSDEWRTKVGSAKMVSWPVGMAGSGNPGVAALLQSTPGGVGYVELAYAVQAGLQAALIRNRAGVFVQPTPAGGTAAAAGLIGVNPTHFSITDGNGKDVYPIATFTWVLLRRQQSDPVQGRTLVYLWRWMITDGQRYATDLLYAPLPPDAQNFGLVQLTKIDAGNEPVIPYLTGG